MKLTYEKKKEIVRLRIEDCLSFGDIAYLCDVGKTTIVDLLNRYSHHGEGALYKIKKKFYTRRKNRSY